MQPQLIAGRYTVLRAIGRGGMGTVWLCRDEVLGRDVAVKQIGALPGESATETKRAMREARSAAALNHPNAVAVYDVVKHEDRPWLVMEYVEGQTLADEIAQQGQLSPQRVADIGAQLAGALARAHERRIVHRDIKPGNVLIDKAGRPKISDFGIARGHGDEQLTQIGFITGTPGYLSPELARGGDPHPASDVWALGATLYAAVEGQPPYEPRSNPIALLRAIASERPRPMTHAGPLAPAVNAMMHEDPALRWDMATSVRRLSRIARTATVTPPVVPDGTAVMAVPPLEPTRALEPTEALEPTQALAPTLRQEAVDTAAAALVVAKPVVPAPVVPAPVVPAPVVEKPVAAVPVVKKPVVGGPVVEKPVAAVPVVKKPVVGGPPVEKPVAAVPVVKKPVVGAPVTDRPLPDGRPGDRHWLPLALVGLLVVVLGIGYLLSPLGERGGAITGGNNPRTTQARPGANATPKSSAQPTSAPVATTALAVDANTRINSFLKSYYADVTRDTGLTWGQLSPRMQRLARGRASYDSFWHGIASVRVNSAQANAAGTSAIVNLTFTKKNGVSSTETHPFSFVSSGGVYLIDSDR